MSGYQAKWIAKAKANTALIEKRKLDAQNGVVPEKKPRFQTKRARANVTETKQDIQSIPLDLLTWEEFKVAQPSPQNIDVTKLGYDFETQQQPDAPNPVFVNISNATGKPIVMKLVGGGTVPNRFGVSSKLSGDYNCNFVLSDSKESARLTALCDKAMAAMTKMAMNFYPKGCSLTHNDFAYRFYSKPTKQRNSADMWPSSLRVSIKNKDIDVGQVTVVKEDGTPIKVLSHMEGMRWAELAVMFQCGMFTYIWSDEQKRYLPQVRIIIKLVGQTRMLEDPDNCHLVYPMQRAEHELQNCVRKHHEPINIRSHPTVANMLFDEPTPTAGGLSVSVHALDGTDLILEFSAGGGLPSFVLGTNQQGNTTINVYIDNPQELDAADQFSTSVTDYLIQNRSKYFPTLTDKSDDAVRGICKSLIKPKKGTTTNESRVMTVRVDIQANGSSCMIVDENDELIDMVNNPEILENRRFQTMWISYWGNYMNTTESGPTKRVRYLKLAPKVQLFTVDGN